MKSKLLNKIWLRSLVVVAVMTTAFAGQAWGANVTITKTTSELVTENGWSVSSGNDNVVCYTSFALDANITISTTGNANCGAIYGTSPNNDWRLYEANNGNITITAQNGCTLNSVTLVYTNSNSGSLFSGTTAVSTGSVQSVSGTSVTYTVGHSSGSKKGQVRITSFSVTYTTVATTAYTVTLNDNNTILTEATPGAGVTLPARDDQGIFEFQGWSENELTSETTSTPQIIHAGSYAPTANVTLYPIYSRSEVEGEGGIEVLAEEMAYNNTNWNLSSENAVDKNSYTLLNNGGYVESTSSFDLSTISKVTVKVRTYGGDSYKSFKVGSGNTTWKTGNASSNTLAYVTLTDGTTMSGTGTIRVTSTAGTSAGQGVGISEVKIYRISGSTTIYYTTHPVETDMANVTNVGWATYITKHPVEFQPGVAYVVTNLSESGATTIQAVTSLPANTPVLLRGAGEKVATILTNVPTAPTTNLLKIARAGTTIPSGCYVLSYTDAEGVGFYHWTGTAALTQDRVYLQPAEGFTPNFIGINPGGKNSIENVSNSSIENNVYDLQGRRVAQPQKGLYIVNGKKIIIK